MPLQIWDGRRPRLERDIVMHRQVQVDQLRIVAAAENLASGADWSFAEDSHKIVVHLDGQLNRLECAFSKGPSGPALPQRGDIWIIPAGCRYAALAQGERAQFVELTIPTSLLADAPLTARVSYRDDFLFGAASRLYDLIEGPADDMASMATHAIVGALSVHLRERFRVGKGRVRRRSLQSRERALLIDAIGRQLDSHHSLASLAAMVDMDVRQFSGAFRSAFGSTPWQYVMRVRLDQAARHLRQSDLSVTEIALATGFATPSHFATAFTRYAGVSPSRYRLLAR